MELTECGVCRLKQKDPCNNRRTAARRQCPFSVPKPGAPEVPSDEPGLYVEGEQPTMEGVAEAASWLMPPPPINLPPTEH